MILDAFFLQHQNVRWEPAEREGQRILCSLEEQPGCLRGLPGGATGERGGGH